MVTAEKQPEISSRLRAVGEALGTEIATWKAILRCGQ